MMVARREVGDSGRDARIPEVARIASLCSGRHAAVVDRPLQRSFIAESRMNRDGSWGEIQDSRIREMAT